MRDLVIPFVHVIATLARLLGPKGASPVQRDRPKNSLKPLSKPNGAIRAGAIRELFSRLPWLSTSQSTKMLPERFSPRIIDPNRIPLALLGRYVAEH